MPDPIYIDHCDHPASTFAGTIMMDEILHDVRFYREQRNWWYCARYGNDPEDYRSGPVRPRTSGFSDSLSREVIIRIFNDEMRLLDLWWQFAKAEKMK